MYKKTMLDRISRCYFQRMDTKLIFLTILISTISYSTSFNISNRTAKSVYKSEPYYFVDIHEGTIRGVKQKTKNGKQIFSFLGVPYASKTKRFQEPAPLKSWKGVKDAIKEGPPCYQYVPKLKTFAGSENCLFANVHTTSLQDKKLPIMVWVHGGSFKAGHGSSTLYKPEMFVEKDVVLVIFNYRLGVFGFLSSGTADAPGNAGLKDITMLLRWVKRNAKHFGGDPDNVTVFGVHAGAAAVDYLTLSPATEGLYKRVIMFSGSASEKRLFSVEPLHWTFVLGKRLKIDTTDVDTLMKALKKMPAKALATAAENLDRDEAIHPFHLTFVPCAEKELTDIKPFLEEYPDSILATGNYNKVPQMIGFARDEGRKPYNKIKNVDALDSVLERFLPANLLSAAMESGNVDLLANMIREFYFNGENAGANTAEGFINYISDAKICYDIIRNIRLKLRHLDQPSIYLIEYAYQNGEGRGLSFNPSETSVERPDFISRIGREDSNESSEEEEDSVKEIVVGRLVTMMINFAKFGNPTPSITDSTPIIWDEIESKDTMDYLELSDSLEMLQNPIKERVELWDAMYDIVFST